MKIAAKLIILLTLAVTAVTVLSSYFSSKQFLANVERRHSLVADVVLAEAGNQEFRTAMTAGDNRYFQRLAGAVAGSSNIRWVWLERDVDESFRPAADEVLDVGNNVKEPRSFVQNLSPGVRALHSYFPVVSQSSERLGAIEITSRLSTSDWQGRQIWFNAILTIGAMALLSIGMIMTAGVRWIARPLDALIKKMKRVGEGDFSSDLETHSRDELGELAAAVNQMCDKLRAQQAEIEFETNEKIAALDQLRHADRLKTLGQLAAGVAHEVGTPLNVVSGRASMILVDNEMSLEQIHENARAIKAESDRISTIVQKLLHFARRSPSQKVEADLREVVGYAADLLRPLAEEKSVTLATFVGDEPANAVFDFGQMQQVVMNLIDNAIDASPTGETVRIVVGRREESPGWVIEVGDRGDGIPDGELEKVFEPFFTTKETGAGTGLGLSIAYGIIEDHGGSLRVESNFGEGATFRVEIPTA